MRSLIKLLPPVQSPGLMQHTPLFEIWIWLCVTSQHMNYWTLSSLRPPSTLAKPLQIQERITTIDTSLQKKDRRRTHSNHGSAATLESDGTGIVKILFAGSWGITCMRPDATCWWNFSFLCGPWITFLEVLPCSVSSLATSWGVLLISQPTSCLCKFWGQRLFQPVKSFLV